MTVFEHRQTREKALESLRLFISTHRNLTDLDLLKLWRGLFFCLWHTPSIPSPSSTHLSTALASLALTIPTSLFPRFYAAFWTTMITDYTSIPQLRLDKYLYLMRLYVRAGFQYFSDHDWDNGLVGEWRAVMEGGKEKVGKWLAPLSPNDGNVPDGIRRLEKGGRTKVVRARAREVLEDERVKGHLGTKNEEGDTEGGGEGEWEGFGD
ncbi:MAG: hypothetical protein Q9218_001888 [Villophora microphyllina]